MKASHTFAMALAVSATCVGGVCAQTVSLYTDHASWIAAGPTLAYASLPTTPANVALAAEVTTPPGTNAAIGPTLTFSEATSGFEFDFLLRAVNLPDDGLEIPRSLVYDDNEAGFPAGQRLISIGDIDGVPCCPSTFGPYQNDDFEIEVWSDGECHVSALGITVAANEASDGEDIRVYGVDGTLLATFGNALPDNDNSPTDPMFVGIVSTEEIGRVFFDEGDDGDDIAIRDFEFGVECPVTIEEETWGRLKARYLE